MLSVAVIGAGVIGLPTALAIQEELGPKAEVIIFTDKLSPHTTGDVSAGLWSPYLLQNTPVQQLTKWSKATQDYILKLWKNGDAKTTGISLQLIMALSNKKDYKAPEWLKISLGHSEFTQDRLKYYSQRYGEEFTGGYAFVGFIWEPVRFLPYLEKKFKDRGGQIRMGRVENFAELSHFDVVVNCSGLGARSLVPDPGVRPIRGQIARVRAPWQKHTFMLDTEPGNYVISNEDCVIVGGTHQEDDFNTGIYDNDRDHILTGCRKYLPSLAKAQVIRDQAGLRPGRDQVRLEIEERRIGEKVMKIVHNYGHGGSGVTLSIGCALDAARLVKEAAGLAGQSKL
ncbi:D-aspartate oxidase [Tribolium castaneum]|uniref:D-aspartate oxidase-like Protein n=1 Tax=Tribolium castaneum TaxID=7070 RepID=D6WAM6_TRICA|nr:PREDICTED: D-aspartate oxidase [Tribolium castaneum]EEZ98651.1 D-aspartate oxidase-like Protein [Tribolium castaneum]|eukprot:XP_974838.1 PREDICTED: D-aspartate oxidase [Tribolium castaneum]